MFLFNSCKEQIRDRTDLPQLNIRTILDGYEIIWGMDFLPDGELIFTEKKGKIYIKRDETVTEISGFPDVLTRNQGGLLDICAHPDYKENGWIYATYSAENQEGGGQLNLIRFKITDNKVSNIENIFSSGGINTWYGHYGSRIAFNKQKYLYLTVGEGGERSYGGPSASNINSQDLTSKWGKIHRMMDDGSIPTDNPVFPGNTEPSTIYSYGHRNPQGLAIHPETGEIWESEHGPRGGDEINVINKGANYGWPRYSLGVNYDGTTISSDHTAEGITGPLYSWNPSIGTCGIAIITGKYFSSWSGNLLVCGLVTEKLHRCIINGNKIIEEEVILKNSGRVRDVAMAPDGSIYVSVENPGRIIQILPE